jgi:diacylglycerol O-acyltransferase / trehalose O-mycolyltransferase
VRIGLIVAVVVLALAAADAQAARVVTWTTATPYVDPSAQTWNGPAVSPPPSSLPVDVYLPNRYDGKRRFPVLYLLHGHGDNYASWLSPKQGDLLDVARGLRAIVVMPEADEGWYADWWNRGARSRPAWERYHLDQLIPLAERRLKILPGRSNHAIAGYSMGGEGAAYYAEQRPGYFGAVASFSGSLSTQRPEWPAGFDSQGQSYTKVYGDPHGFYAAAHNPTAMVRNLRYTRVLVRVGNGVPNPTSTAELANTFGQVAEAELNMHARDFVAAARRAAVDVTFEPHQGIHDWPYWRADLAAAIRWGLFRPVAEHPSTWTYRTAARRSAAWGYAFDFTAPPAAVESFALHRCTLSANGSGSVSVTPPAGARLRRALPFSVRPRGCGAHGRRPRFTG